MRKDGRLCRSHDAVVGGVCAGFAERFSWDVAAVRIVVVVATLLTSGLAAIAYAILWLVLPDSSENATPVNVEPERVHSETYGTPIDPQAAAGPCEPGVPCAQQGTGHIPPRPPQGTGPVPVPPPAPTAPPRPVQPASLRMMLILGLVVVSALAAMLFSSLILEVSFTELWPIGLLAGGILVMVVPTDGTSHARTFSYGLVIFAAGVVMLMVTTELMSEGALVAMVARLWPAALIMAGLALLSRSLDEPWFALAGAVVFAVLCVYGLARWGAPGDVHALTLALPGKALFLPNPWM